jgi:hypothetical protein
MERVVDASVCREITDKHLDYFSFDAKSWLANPNNYALKHKHNIAFAEFVNPSTYKVHFCFDEARGNEAVLLTLAVFEEFSKRVPAMRQVIGCIDVNNRKAKWVVRKAGFQSLGVEETEAGSFEVFSKIRN